jgi:alkaline phosphatase
MNNAEDVLALGSGRGSEAIKGFMDNTAIFELLKNAL